MTPNEKENVLRLVHSGVEMVRHAIALEGETDDLLARCDALLLEIQFRFKDEKEPG